MCILNYLFLSSYQLILFPLLSVKTIESSPCGENSAGEAVNLSQLHLIDLAGSESSKAETTGVRRKEGSYINKSLLTLGTKVLGFGTKQSRVNLSERQSHG